MCLHMLPPLARQTLNELHPHQHEHVSLMCVHAQKPPELALVPCALSAVDTRGQTNCWLTPDDAHTLYRGTKIPGTLPSFDSLWRFLFSLENQVYNLRVTLARLVVIILLFHSSCWRMVLRYGSRVLSDYCCRGLLLESLYCNQLRNYIVNCYCCCVNKKKNAYVRTVTRSAALDHYPYTCWNVVQLSRSVTVDMGMFSAQEVKNDQLSIFECPEHHYLAKNFEFRGAVPSRSTSRGRRRCLYPIREGSRRPPEVIS